MNERKLGSKRHRALWRLAILGLVIGSVGLMTWWNSIGMPGSSHQGPLPPADQRLKQLGAELRRDVTQIAERIGQRNVSSAPDALARSADAIEAGFAEAGYAVQRQGYDVAGVTCHNLEVEIVGQSRPDEIVIIGAHYDSVPGSPAANDNGSGVAALLSLARHFKNSQHERTLRFVAFVNEEMPYFQTQQMGSWVYARRCRQRAEVITAMLSLETIGYYSDSPGSQKLPPPLGRFYPSTGNFIAFVGNLRSSSLVRRVVGTFRRHEAFPAHGGALPEMIPGVGFSDQWAFWQEGYRALMVTDTAMYRYPYYHTAEDTVDKIDFDRTARVVRGLQSVVADLAGEQPSRR